MKVFLDTNVLLDFADARNNAFQAEAILNLGKRGEIVNCASYLSYANINYIKRDLPRATRYQLIRDLRKDITVLPCDAVQLNEALAHEDVRDFEDLLQYKCAQAAGCDVIVTNNTKDYQEFCDIPFMSSRDFLLHYFIHEEKQE